MVTLPDKSALGQRLPGATMGVPQFRNPGAVGQALSGAGQAITGAGADFGEARRLQNEGLSDAEKFGVNTRFLEFEQQWRDTYNERVEGANPGGVGFRESLTSDYEKRAREFLRTVPEPMRPEMDQKLFRLESRLADNASGFEREELDRYSGNQVDEGLNRLLNRLTENPDDWSEIEQEGVDLIRSAPGWGPIERDEAERAWRERRAVFDASTRQTLGDESVGSDLGVPENYIDKLISVESGGDPNARASTSSAEGHGQFIASTWLQTVRRYEPQLFDGRSREEVLALRRDPATSRRMTQYFTAENRSALESAGLPITDGTLYLAHFAGAGDAIKLMRAGPDTPAEQVVSPASVEANPSILRGKTARDVISWAENKMGQEVSPMSPRYANLGADDRVKMLTNIRADREAQERRREQEFLSDFGNYVSALGSGATVSDTVASRFSDGAISAMVSDPTQEELIRQTRDDAQAQSIMASQIRGGTPDQIDAIAERVESMTGEVTDDVSMALFPQRANAQQAFRTALEADMKARLEDPAKYTMQAAPEVARMAELSGGSEILAQTMLAQQAHYGIPAHLRRVMTHDQAAETVASINRMDVADRGPALAQLQEQWGKHSPDVLRQLKENELHPATYHAAMVGDDPALSERISALASVEAKELEAGLETTEVRDLKADVFSELQDFRMAFEAGDPTGQAAVAFNEVLGIAEGLALQEYRRTGDMSGAVEVAADRFINDRYQVLDGGNMLAYLPASRDSDAIEAGAEQVLDTLPGLAPLGGDENAPEFLRDSRIRTAAQNGVWVTNERGDGLTLMVDVEGRLQMLFKDDGEPYGFSFDELEGLAPVGAGAASAGALRMDVTTPRGDQLPPEGLTVAP